MIFRRGQIETDAMFSPDGPFVAYVSNESGGFAVALG